MTDRHERVGEIIKHLAAEFLSRESNRTSLITVTNIDLARDMSKAIILVSIFPENKTKGAIDFVKRKRNDFRDYVKQNSKLRRIPRFDFELDLGEKNRQNIDNLLQN